MSNHVSVLRRRIALGAALVTAASGTVLVAQPAQAVSADVVISEVYGGGGNAGATLKNDFIELYNRGLTTVDISEWSVQYASSTGTSWQVTALDGKIPPGKSYLVQEAEGAGGTTPLPTPDAIGTIPMSGTSGKVALVTNQTALPCGADCDTNAAVRDFVGYGSANDFEGAPTSQLSNTSSADRDAVGTDTDNNAADFNLPGTPNPQNCGEECEGVIEPPPDPEVLTIMDIQGVGHLSDDEGVLVETSGVTTAVSGNGYWIQDPAGDGNAMTSDGIFVFTGSGGAKPAVGDAVTVTGTVDEFRPGGSGGPGLNITEITGSPTFETTSSGNPLPVAVLIGRAGVQAPVDIIDNDSPASRIDIEVMPPASYDPAEDAIDFYEQYEGMLLQVNSPNVVGPTSGFGELVVLPRGANDYVRTPNGGVVYAGYDSPNPRRLILDDSVIGVGNMDMPDANTGDRIDGQVVGVLDYSFNNFKLQVTAPPAIADGGVVREVTKEALATELAVATFNVENLDPSDDQAKFDALAAIVVHNLQSPDVVALEEVQDNNGATNDAVVDANLTLDQLVTAITAAGGPGGPVYAWRQISPEDDQDGGQPGGNIRNAFLFRTDRGLAFVDRPGGTATVGTSVVKGADGHAELEFSPGRVDPTNLAWANSRKPLAGEFTWNGENLIVIANHFASKGGDEPLFGRWQPPTRSSEVQRHLQAKVLNDFVDEVLAVDAEANVVVAGDINDFEFSKTIDILTGEDAALADLVQYLRPRQRYTYVFDGNSQVLDHLLVSPSLAPAEPIAGAKPVKIRRDYDIVHVNADFFDQVSDHEPQVVRLRFGTTP